MTLCQPMCLRYKVPNLTDCDNDNATALLCLLKPAGAVPKPWPPIYSAGVAYHQIQQLLEHVPQCVATAQTSIHWQAPASWQCVCQCSHFLADNCHTCSGPTGLLLALHAQGLLAPEQASDAKQTMPDMKCHESGMRGGGEDRGGGSCCCVQACLVTYQLQHFRIVT